MITTNQYIIPVLIVFIIRMILPVLFWVTDRRIIATDGVGHICSSKFMRRNGHRPSLKVSGTKESEEYPFLYSWLISFLPEKWMMPVAMMTGAIFDTALFAVIITAVRDLTGITDASNLILLAFLFSFTPLITRITTGKVVPRPRPMGVFFGGAIIYLLILYQLNERPLSLYLGAILLYVPVSLGSKFATQAIILICTVFGILTGDIRITIFPLLAIIASIALTGGMSLRLLAGQVRASIMYWMHFYGFVDHKNRFSFLKSLSVDEFKRIVRLYAENSYVIVLTGLPMLLPIVWYFMKHDYFGSPVIIGMLKWIVAGLIAMFVTSIWKLRVFGQGERYMDFCVIPYMILCSLFIKYQGSQLVYINIVYGFIIYVLYVIVHYRSYGASKEIAEQYYEGYKWLSSAGKKKRIISIPYAYSCFGMSENDHEYLFSEGLCLKRRDEVKHIFSDYSYPPLDLAAFVNRYKVDYVVVIKKSTKGRRYAALDRMVYENQVLEIYDTCAHISDPS